MIRCIALALLLAATPALADDPAPPDATVDAAADSGLPDARWYVGIKGGVTTFLNSQSKVLEHFMKPVVKLEVGWVALPDLLIGVELSAIADASEYYRVAGVTAVGRAAFYRGDVFSFWFGWGAGAGLGPRILAPDLIAQSQVTLWVQAGLLFRWQVVPDVFSLGIDILNENASLLTTAGTVQLHF